MVGSVDNELKGLYNACSTQVSNYQNDIAVCTDQRNILTADKTNLQSMLNQTQLESQRVQNFLLNETKKKIDEAEARVRWRNWAFIITLVVVVGSIMYKRRYEAENHMEF